MFFPHHLLHKSSVEYIRKEIRLKGKKDIANVFCSELFRRLVRSLFTFYFLRPLLGQYRSLAEISDSHPNYFHAGNDYAKTKINIE